MSGLSASPKCDFSESQTRPEFRIHYGEFVRLEIQGTWHRISGFVDWRLHGRLKKADEAVDNVDHNGDGDKIGKLWIDNNSLSDDTNNG